MLIMFFDLGQVELQGLYPLVDVVRRTKPTVPVGCCPRATGCESKPLIAFHFVGDAPHVDEESIWVSSFLHRHFVLSADERTPMLLIVGALHGM